MSDGITFISLSSASDSDLLTKGLQSESSCCYSRYHGLDGRSAMLAHEGIKFKSWIFSLAMLLVSPWAVGAAKVPQAKDPQKAPRLTEIPIKQVVIDDKF